MISYNVVEVKNLADVKSSFKTPLKQAHCKLTKLFLMKATPTPNPN